MRVTWADILDRSGQKIFSEKATIRKFLSEVRKRVKKKISGAIWAVIRIKRDTHYLS